MVQSSKDEIYRILFDTVYEASINFTQSMSARLAEDDLDDLVRFRANAFRRAVDQITTSIDERFSQNG
ncbi:Hypothetical predicted protein [Paramuricea clavata]|uniref:Uncharacterized protein n=1 Tax=Paramuricea clavata TaxID=317549 RepID=A0A7D9HLZ7_PARCT|nr:Hypothetical predicted protein [Paramuricea clavata]